MAPRIALIHATALAMAPIQAAFQKHWPQSHRMHLLDDSLSVDLSRDRHLTQHMIGRFVALAQYAKGTGCHGILFTCSAFGPAIEAAREATGLPTLKPNEAMFEQALASAPAAGACIGLMATFEASIASMSLEFDTMAKDRGQRVALQTVYVPEAMQDLAEGHADLHHEKIARAAQHLTHCDAIMLAQFSMAAAVPVVQAKLRCPVLSSPDCAVLAMQKMMPHD